MNFKRWTALIMVLLLLQGGIASFAVDRWEKPTYVHGAGLNEAQVQETARLLGITDMNTVTVIPVKGEDLVRFLKAENTGDASMISSVLVTKNAKGTGLQVVIQTPENITQITPEIYKNAAITAGVVDASLQIAAYTAVTGESALTGIYKAFEANGETLDDDRMQVAQEELETTNQIAQENKEKDGFDLDKLNQVIIEIKQQLAEIKEKQGELATREDIERIIQELLDKYQLQNVITQVQIDKLINLFVNYQQTGAIDASAVKEQLNKLSTEVTGKIKDFVQNAKESGLLDRIADFFRQIFDSIMSLFKGSN